MSKLKAELLPLDGKYYGTEVKIMYGTDNDYDYTVVEIWFGGNHKPSRRELEGYVLRDGEWMEFDEPTQTWYPYEISDTHYETETSLEVAELLVKAINSLEG